MGSAAEWMLSKGLLLFKLTLKLMFNLILYWESKFFISNNLICSQKFRQNYTRPLASELETATLSMRRALSGKQWDSGP